MQKKPLVIAAITGALLLTVGVDAMAAVDPAVDTAITAAQGDAVAIIAKGYGYLGVIGAALVGLGIFWKILRKPAR